MFSTKTYGNVAEFTRGYTFLPQEPSISPQKEELISNENDCRLDTYVEVNSKPARTAEEQMLAIGRIRRNSLENDAKPEEPVFTLSGSAIVVHLTSQENPIQKVQFYAYNKVMLTLADGQEVAVSSAFLKFPKLNAVKFAEYLRQTHFVFSKLSDGNYSVTESQKLVGGGLGTREIHDAALKGNTEALRQVLETKVKKEKRYLVDVETGTLSDYASPRTALFIACSEGTFDNVKLLVEAGANVNFRVRDGTSCLHQAAYKGNLKVVEYLLSTGRIDNIDNGYGSDNMTPLALACQFNRIPVIKCLLKNGADPDCILSKVSAKFSPDVNNILRAHREQSRPAPAASSSSTYTNTNANLASSSSSSEPRQSQGSQLLNTAVKSFATAAGKEFANDMFNNFQ